MRLLIPDQTITLNSTNIAASSIDEWSASSVSYTTGSQVKYTTGQPMPQHEFECIESHTSSAANKPVIGGTQYWADMGATNQHSMWNGKNNTRSVATDISGDIVTEFTMTRRNQFIVLLGMKNVTSARIVETVGSDVVADNTISLVTRNTPVGMWSFLFGERVFTKSLIQPLFGIATTRTIALTLEGAPTAEIAQAMVVQAHDLGCTKTGASPRLQSFSTFEPDSYGGYKYVARPSTRQGSYTVWIDTDQVDRVYNLMEQLEEDGTLVVLDANNEGTSFDSVRAYGKITDFSPGITYDKTAFDIKIEGIN